MKAKVDVEGGVCGFRTCAAARSEDDQNVFLDVESDCETIRGLACGLERLMPLDAYQEISPQAPSLLLSCVAEHLKGCCAGCAVPAGLFKVMQVAAGVALPKDVTIKLGKG